MTIGDATRAAGLARALLRGGVAVIEVTLRTPAALKAIRVIRSEVPEMIVGAGTVLSSAQLESVRKLDVAFAVSPGSTPRLLDAAAGSALPLLPGVATASEAMTLLERGIALAKLFPAGPAGGAGPAARARGPLPGVGFLPDPRDRCTQRPGLPRAHQRALRRRLLARAGRGDRRR